MDISIAFFFVELLRSATGGLCVAAQDGLTLALEARSEVPIEAEAASETPTEAADDLIGQVPGARIVPGLIYFQDPVGIDPTTPPGSVNTAGSILGTEDEALPAFLEGLAKSGVIVEPGAVHEYGGGATPLATWTGGLVATRYRLRQYTLIPPTGYAEPFTLMVPSPLPTSAQPLMVVFHKFASTNLDVLQNTDFVRECALRGWFLVCPLGASKKHFSSIESQVNTEAVLDWMLANTSLRIDRQRIYGVGFSMGGGAVLNYAARHRDPAHAVLAALINHSGNTSLNDTYYNDGPARFIFDFWYGDGSTGSANHWKMSRSSVLDFNPVSMAIDTSNDLARNLASTPLASWRASNDSIPYLPAQNDLLDQHLRLNLGRTVGNSYSYNVVPYTGHDWRMLDASAACDWLGQFSLQMPTSGNTLADHDGIYEQFFVEQDLALAFTPFTWSCDSGANELHVSATENLKRLTIDPIASGLSITSTLNVFMQSADGTGDELVLARWPMSPSAVTRDGVATANWSFDSLTHDLTLVGTDGAAHVWAVTP